MIDSKHINKIIAGVVVLALIFCGFIVYAANAYEPANVPAYQKLLFNDKIVEIDIQVNAEEWQSLLDNPEAKEYISGDLTINGEVFESVGVRTKGNSTITEVAESESDRYSLTVNLNKYVNGQTYYGLDSFCLNNINDDPTYMKEYISYEIMNYIGVAAPLTNYAKVSVNGEDYGFLLLLERYDQAFLDRVYNTSAGHFYNVKRNRDNPELSTGGSLLYDGDEISSYTAIFDNVVFNKTTEEDMQRVITAIKNLNEGTDLEQYWDVDEILRYFAAHTVIANFNSYISDKEQNYYIYEVDGKVTILPWSYHLAFGGNLKTNEKTSNVVNLSVDTPLYGVEMEERPLLNVLLEIDEYKEKYYEYLRKIVEGYFDSGLFEQTINDLDEKISEYVKNDTTTFYTHEQYKESLPTLIEIGELRAESVSRQLLANTSPVDISSVSPLSYQEKLFGSEVVTIDIQIDQEEWQNLLDNGQSKPWVEGTVVINGEAFGSVGVRTKGNSSLSTMGGMGGRGNSSSSSTGNYSLNFKMNKYVQGQTYYGLDVFCVNNMTGDATYMKDNIAYSIMNYIGAPSLLAGYAKVTVNGEDYGFGTLLERYDESFTDRVYNDREGFLYSAKIGMGQRENFEQFGAKRELTEEQANNVAQPDTVQPEGNARANLGNMIGNFNMGGRGGGFGGFGGSNGGTLIYSGDELSSYSAILDNAVFGTRTTEEDEQRIVEAIKNLNEGTDLEKYWDVDGALRYFAAHTVVVNLDSYVSNMAQNYYLYEKDGKVTILPWDYNLAFGGYQGGSASSFVNFPIDTPVSGVNMEDRPLLNVLLEIPEYKEKYHQYLREIVEGYFNSGLFEQTVREFDEMINEYVKNDVSAFFTYEQYQSALEVFVEACLLRAESIVGQLDGTIPSTTEGQNADSSALIDASQINLSSIGSMGGGGDRNFGGDMSNMPAFNMQDMNMDVMMQAMQIIMEASGEITEEIKASLIELGLTEEQIETFTGTQNMFPGNMGQGGFPDMNEQMPNESNGESVGQFTVNIPNDTDTQVELGEQPSDMPNDIQGGFGGQIPDNMPNIVQNGFEGQMPDKGNR